MTTATGTAADLPSTNTSRRKPTRFYSPGSTTRGESASRVERPAAEPSDLTPAATEGQLRYKPALEDKPPRFRIFRKDTILVAACSRWGSQTQAWMRQQAPWHRSTIRRHRAAWTSGLNTGWTGRGDEHQGVCPGGLGFL